MIFPEEFLLAQLCLRVEIAALGIGLERCVLIDQRPACQPRCPVHAKRADQHDLGRTLPAQHSFQQVLRSHHGIQKQIRGSTAGTCGQVVNHIRIVERS